MEKENEKKLRPEVRKVVKVKGSYQVTIPKKFVNHYSINKGDLVTFVAGVELISVLPMKGD